jgi:hypothetical protein
MAGSIHTWLQSLRVLARLLRPVDRGEDPATRHHNVMVINAVCIAGSWTVRCRASARDDCRNSRAGCGWTQAGSALFNLMATDRMFVQRHGSAVAVAATRGGVVRGHLLE